MILPFFQVFAWTMFKLLVVWLHLSSTQELISYLCMPVIVNKPWWQYKPISFESWYYLFLLRNILYETSLWGLSLVPLFGSSLWDLFLGPTFWRLSLVPLSGAILWCLPLAPLPRPLFWHFSRTSFLQRTLLEAFFLISLSLETLPLFGVSVWGLSFDTTVNGVFVNVYLSAGQH